MSTLLSRSFWIPLIGSLTTTVRMFPREMILSVISALATIGHLETDSDEPTIYLRIALAGIVAMNLSFALRIVRESKRISLVADWIIWAVGTGLVSWLVSGLDIANTRGIASYAYVIVAAHALVASSWMTFGSADRSWTANMRMFLKLLIATLFTNVSEVGLTLAIVAVRVLFQIEALPHLEQHINIFCLFVLTTLFFFRGHQQLTDINQPPSMGKVLDVFVRFVLLPLIIIFTVILAAYGVKLIGSSIVPEMTYYVLWLNGFTILALLLSWPERSNPNIIWRILHRFALPVQLPLLALAVWAWSGHLVDAGISYDGFTTAALLVVAVCASLIGSVMGRLDPRVVPVLLFVVFGLTATGPIGVAEVSERSLTLRGKTDQLNKWSAVGQAVYRSSNDARLFQSSLVNGVWQGAFHIGNYNDESAVTLQDKSGSHVRIKAHSTWVVVWGPQLADTIAFDAAKCFVPGKDSLRSLTIVDSTRTINVVCSDLTIKRPPTDSLWSITSISASVFVVPHR